MPLLKNMRGFPLVNLLTVLLLLTAAVYPVMRRVTDRLDGPVPAVDETAPLPETAPQIKTVPVLLSLRLAHPAVEFEISQGEKAVWSEKPEVPLAERQAKIDLPWEENGVEFTLRVRWPEGTPDTVAEVGVSPDGYETKRQNVWSGGAEADEVLRFTWPEGGAL